jgi:glycosyltransferase involved in cell wall biosynthesis
VKILIALRSVQLSEGGPITAAAGLADALAKSGHDVVVSGHDDGLGAQAVEGFPVRGDVAVKVFPRSSRLWEHSAAYRKWLNKHVRDFDLVLINSVWISHVFYASRACQDASVPYVIRPHGCLTKNDMKHSKLRKRVYLRLVERRHLKAAQFVHCTSQAEVDDCRNFGVKNARLIPLGVDQSLLQIGRKMNRTCLLYVGRIAEKKGLDIAIAALSRPPLAEQEVRLDVLGVDHIGMQESLERLAKECGVEERVVFHGHVDEERRNDFLQRACALVLPSKDENFGLAVAEGLAAGVPAIITRNVSHAELLESYMAGLIVDRNAESVASAVDKILRLPDREYGEMSAAARQLVLDNYSWARTASLVLESTGLKLPDLQGTRMDPN